MDDSIAASIAAANETSGEGIGSPALRHGPKWACRRARTLAGSVLEWASSIHHEGWCGCGPAV